MTETMVKADAAGSWRLGETTVNRVGLGAMDCRGTVERSTRADHATEKCDPHPAHSAPPGTHVLTIPGTGNPDHLADNVAAAALRLSADEVSRLDGLG